MKINLNIQAAPHTSFFCRAWIDCEDSLWAPEPLPVKVGNRAIADLITGTMSCRVELPGRALLSGDIRRAGNENDFIIEKTGSRREK